MKRLFVLCSLFLSTYLMADHHHWMFRGHGEWVKDSGETGNYRVAVHGHHVDGGLKLKQTYRKGDKSWTMTYMLKKKEHGFYDVMKDGNKIGGGYCFKGENHKTCHHHLRHEGHKVETTVHVMGHRAYRIGSVHHDGKVVKFHDKMRKVEHDHRQQQH